MPTDEQKAAIKEKLDARQAHMRESWVRSMEARLVRDQLDICQRSEGVNSYENCRWLAEKYAGMIQTHKMQGYKLVDKLVDL
ncbi:hypothetical protein CYLTODRAFT_491374 [Cylindrobasidium torrendii FP15055 ss-10]|uniref:NADH-ubiquinone oxidoreductase 12 kDa subunit n=1 Tax=Cylindrobasidium torrendii FP15055 ss-10 TaxID=1314674 RepID=A0A0D7B7Q2_9AGAR|nr:hypothetical protein CYLTODRAFT_491374 [Cylindrobasidium torrendii FP15055 ss-10]